MPDSKTKSKGLGILKAAGEALLSVTNDVLKNKTGIDVQKGYEIFKKGNEEGKLEYKRKHSYDIYFDLNKVMEELASVLESISEEYTIIFLVDELDRCIPEYAIKVLERLHHLTEGKSNIITVISMDKDQLKKSVEKIFGIVIAICVVVLLISYLIFTFFNAKPLHIEVANASAASPILVTIISISPISTPKLYYSN